MEPTNTSNFWANKKPDTLIAVGVLFLIFMGSAATIADRRVETNKPAPAKNQIVQKPATVRDESLNLREGKFLPPGELENIKAFGSRRLSNPCSGLFAVELLDGTYCTHGPDATLAAANLPKKPQANTQNSTPKDFGKKAVAGVAVTCDGDGKSGKRVQNLYVRTADQQDKYTGLLPTIKANTVAMNNAMINSAKKSNGDRHIIFVQDPASCEATVENVTIPAASSSCPNETLNGKCIVEIAKEIQRKGYNKKDRKYVIWLDGNQQNVCGQAFTPGGKDITTDTPSLDNINNTSNAYAFVYRNCWDNTQQPGRGLHELTHILGAVQLSAPNSDKNGHCSDGEDVLCNAQDIAPNFTLKQTCVGFAQFEILDCNNDDYFHTNPPSGSYLATHWNVASSEFLARGAVGNTTICSQGDDFCNQPQPNIQTPPTPKLTVLFDFDRALIKPEFQPQLTALVNTLKSKDNANKTVTLEGHTDPVGIAAYNITLSQRRADAIKSYLILKGIPAARILTVAKGETMPLATPVLSRRVEIFY